MPRKPMIRRDVLLTAILTAGLAAQAAPAFAQDYPSRPIALIVPYAAGTGSGIHLGTEYFATMAGIKLTHIPYKGSGPALTDLVGGHVAVYFSSLPPALALVKEGKVRALAVTGAKRSPIFPDLPTVAE